MPPKHLFKPAPRISKGVFWINCTGRTRAGILGDVAHALGLRLPGTVEQNEAALREFCAARRCLFIFENIAGVHRESVSFGGKASTVFTSDRLDRERRSFEDIAALFRSWTQKPHECAQAVGDASGHLPELGNSIVAVLKHQDRLAEAYEVLEKLVQIAEPERRFQHSLPTEVGARLDTGSLESTRFPGAYP